MQRFRASSFDLCCGFIIISKTAVTRMFSRYKKFAFMDTDGSIQGTKLSRFYRFAHIRGKNFHGCAYTL